jgi:hypothetical protein
MNEAVTGRCVRMSWSELSDSGICSVWSDCVCGRVGASSMTETTWVSLGDSEVGELFLVARSEEVCEV